MNIYLLTLIGDGMLEQQRTLYLALYNPRTMMRVMERLRELGLQFKGVYERQRAIYGVVMVDEEGYRYLEDNSVRILGPLVFVDDVDKAVAHALVLAKGLDFPLSNLVVGIDLGASIGFAVVGDSKVLMTKLFVSKLKFFETLCWVIEKFESKRRCIRIGFTRSTFDDYKADIVDRIAKMIPSDVELELVPERGSSKLRPGIVTRGLHEDEIAALNIALGRTS